MGYLARTDDPLAIVLAGVTAIIYEVAFAVIAIGGAIGSVYAIALLTGYVPNVSMAMAAAEFLTPVLGVVVFWLSMPGCEETVKVLRLGFMGWEDGL